MFQSIIHYGIHFGLPLIIALFFFKSRWKYAYFIMILGLLIDVDHVLANPIFDPNRCSINFHPLHSYYAIAGYILMLSIKKLRLLGIGLLVHIIADLSDCWLM
ncbi:hypothetical protein A9Q87_07410 [Flavobacteriales bacterium 34_180_T64]|nr:hypothetical protein A9Q87_07410 [Flavobacteriales bacterium 34_180_T64]